MHHATRNIIELKSLPQLARAVALPGDHDPVRLPTYPAVERTSVLSFNATNTISVGTVQMPTQPVRGALFKHSAFPLWLDQTAPTPFLWTARWDVSHQVGLTTTAQPLQTDATGVVSAVGNGTQQYDQITATGVTSVKAVPLGEFNGYPYVFVPKGTRFGVILHSPVGLGGADVEVEYVGLGGQVARDTVRSLVLPTGGAGAYGHIYVQDSTFVRPLTAMYNGAGGYVDYISIVVSNSNAQPNCVFNGTTWAITVTGTAQVPAMLPALLAPALSTSTIPFSNTRTPALSALFTNVTKALNKEGTVHAGRLNPEIVNPFDFDTSTYTQLLPSEKYFYGLEQGFYTYVPMSDSMDHFKDDIYNRMNSDPRDTLQNPWLHLGDNSLINTFLFSDPDGTTALAVNVDWHIEYRNTSVLWPSAISSVSIETAHQLQLVLLQTGFFFENVTHRVVLNALTKALGYFKAYAPDMIKGALHALPGGSAIYSGTKALLAAPVPRKKDRKQRKRKPGPSQVAKTKPNPTTLQVQTAPKKQGGLAMYLAKKR